MGGASWILDGGVSWILVGVATGDPVGVLVGLEVGAKGEAVGFGTNGLLHPVPVQVVVVVPPCYDSITLRGVFFVNGHVGLVV